MGRRRHRRRVHLRRRINTSPGPASAFDEVDGDPPHHQNLIVMTKNGDHDGTLDAACLGTVTTYQMRAKRKQKIRWHIQNDLFNKCQDLDESMVEVRFDNAVMAETTDTGASALSVLKAVKGKITARVHANPTKAVDGHYKYSGLLPRQACVGSGAGYQRRLWGVRARRPVAGAGARGLRPLPARVRLGPGRRFIQCARCNGRLEPPRRQHHDPHPSL